MMKKKYLFFGIVGIVILLVIGWLFYVMSYRPKMLCQEAIKEQLKSPASAEFSNFQKLDDNNYLYTVDSQNGFGAMIRHKWLCTKITNKIFCNITSDGLTKEERIHEKYLEEKEQKKKEKCRKIKKEEKEGKFYPEYEKADCL